MNKLAIFNDVLNKIDWALLKNEISFAEVDFSEPLKEHASSKEFKEYLAENFKK